MQTDVSTKVAQMYRDLAEPVLWLDMHLPTGWYLNRQCIKMTIVPISGLAFLPRGSAACDCTDHSTRSSSVGAVVAVERPPCRVVMVTGACAATGGLTCCVVTAPTWPPVVINIEEDDKATDGEPYDNRFYYVHILCCF